MCATAPNDSDPYKYEGRVPRPPLYLCLCDKRRKDKQEYDHNQRFEDFEYHPSDPPPYGYVLFSCLGMFDFYNPIDMSLRMLFFGKLLTGG